MKLPAHTLVVGHKYKRLQGEGWVELGLEFGKAFGGI